MTESHYFIKNQIYKITYDVHRRSESIVLLNLAHDPRTSEQTRQTMARISESANPELRRLQRRVLAGTGIRRQAVQTLLFHALRGLAVSHLMLETLPDQASRGRHIADQRRLLAEALGMLIEAQSQGRA